MEIPKHLVLDLPLDFSPTAQIRQHMFKIHSAQITLTAEESVQEVNEFARTRPLPPFIQSLAIHTLTQVCDNRDSAYETLSLACALGPEDPPS